MRRRWIHLWVNPETITLVLSAYPFYPELWCAKHDALADLEEEGDYGGCNPPTNFKYKRE